MTVTIESPVEVTAHFAASLRLTVASAPSLTARDAELELDGMRQVVTDMTLRSHPPLSVVFDMLRIVLHFDHVQLDAAGAGEILNRYRLKVLANLVRDDPSVRALARAVATRGRHARRMFTRFLARELAHSLARIPHTFPFRYACTDLPTLAACAARAPDPGYMDGQARALAGLVESYPTFQPLFDPAQVSMLSNLRDERDIAPLRELHTIRSHLEPVEPTFGQRTRRTRDLQVEVEHRQSPTMGGIVGLSSGASLDQVSMLLPSELALMDRAGEGQVDLFDVKLLERRLLFFERDRNVSIRRGRCFHVVLCSPSEFDYRPAVVEGRWQSFFIAVVLDIICSLSRDRAANRYSFHVLFMEASGRLDRWARVIEAARIHEVPASTVDTRVVDPDQLGGYLDGLSGDGQVEHTVISVANNPVVPATIPSDVHHVHLSFSADASGDAVRVAGPSSLLRDPSDVYMHDPPSFRTGLNQVRNELLLRIADGHARTARRRREHAASRPD